jgi:hypothetical protein
MRHRVPFSSSRQYETPVFKGVDMKKILLLTMAVICVSSLAYGQTQMGSIDIFADAAHTSCNITVPDADLFQVFVYHTNVITGSTASAWSIDHPATFTNVGEVSPFTLKVGNSDTGVSFSYEQCKTGTFLLLTVSYFGIAPTATCGLMTIIGDPNSTTGGVEIVDCAPFPGRTSWEQAGQARLNPDVTCMCSVPVEETTWGGIKALYVE